MKDSEREELCRILRDPGTKAETIRALAEDRRLNAAYWVRTEIVLRPDLPLSMGLGLLPTLLWRDLARVMEDMRLCAPIRVRAEMLLAERLDEMALGERIALARIASRGLVRRLKSSSDPGVIAALLGNSRLVADDVVAMARSEETPPSVLSVIGHSERWGGHYAVKVELAQNPRCPPVESLRALRGLMPRDLQRITDNPAASRLVRMGAHRRLSESCHAGR